MRLGQKLCVFLISIISLPTWQDDLRAADSKEEELRDAWSAEYLKLASETRIVSKSNSAEIAVKISANKCCSNTNFSTVQDKPVVFESRMPCAADRSGFLAKPAGRPQLACPTGTEG